MGIGLLLFANFLVVPLVSEIEALAEQHPEGMRFRDILRFRNIRGTRWLKLYVLMMLILGFIFFIPKGNAAQHDFKDTWMLVLRVVVLQAVVWGYLGYRIRKMKSKS